MPSKDITKQNNYKKFINKKKSIIGKKVQNVFSVSLMGINTFPSSIEG